MSNVLTSSLPADERNSVLPKPEARRRLRRWRSAKDGASRAAITLGGLSVIGALALMFLYLLSEVVPMLAPASAEREARYGVPGGIEASQFFADRNLDVGVALGQDGSVTAFDLATGAPTETAEEQRLVPEDRSIVSFAAGEPRTGLFAYGLDDGRAVVARQDFSLSYPDDVRHTEPVVDRFLGEEPFVVDPEGQALTVIGVQGGPQGVMIAAATEDGRIRVIRRGVDVNMLSGEEQVVEESGEFNAPVGGFERLLVAMDLRSVVAGDGAGRLHLYDVRDLENPRLLDSKRVTPDGVRITALEFLLGTVSLIVGDESGGVHQWFPVRDEDNVPRLTPIREFDSHTGTVTAIAPEHARKGFATADETGEVAIRYSTSHRTLYREQAADGPLRNLAFAPRANALMAAGDDGQLHYFAVDNPHPQVSLRALWDRVWYEGYEEPEHVWQSSSATDEFEPKFSLVPLTIGTIKAAFYAMLFAMPLAIMGAVYTAYFMSARMRAITKPSIEIMEALPTVILGFLAGLWFAPFLERHLPAVFSILILLPLGILATAWLWSRIPAPWRGRIPGGWEAAILIPVIVVIGWASVAMSPILEVWFFDGEMRQWLTDQGIAYDQRNALIVGVAMGFAVIPTIFSIAEDAIFNVPRHLTQGSLALGATTWQTVTRVVLLTASPGIFSAVMIGLGRAVGETMIVLMATGNTPITNFNIFEGMRTLSANIAVELPESAVGGTHFRILFLSALLLFVLTFLLNTAAEIVRQRLRRKYASL